MALLRDASADNLPSSIKWTFANIAARDAQGVVYTDVGRLCFIADTKTLCVLESYTPVTWRAFLPDPYHSSSPAAPLVLYLRSSGGTTFAVTVGDDGALTTTVV